MLYKKGLFQEKYKRIFITTEGKKAVVQCNRILNEFEESLYRGFSKKEMKQTYQIFNNYYTIIKIL